MITTYAMCQWLFGVLLLVVNTGQLFGADNPFLMGYNEVTAGAGTIQGTKENITAFGKTYEYFAYRGIRYAKDTGGANRFKKPVPMDKFSGVYKATEFTNSCTQTGTSLANSNMSADPMYHQRTGEDCLSLNVFTPTDKGTKKAVMVWIHGGAWVAGSGLIYFGGLLAPFGDVVYVSVNFRLGAFGFLSTGDSSARGNMAYFDQLLALKWVKDNIKDFGGDPDMVTIFGESAGGLDVSAHAISQLSAGKGLFKRVISTSGSAVSPKENPMNVRLDIPVYTKNLGLNLRCNGTNNPTLSDSGLLLECLRKKSASEILKYADEEGNLPPDAVVKGRQSFSPTVDGEFLPEHPANLVKNTTLAVYQVFKNVDLISSFNSNDGNYAFFSMIPILMKAGITGPSYLIPKEFMHKYLLPGVFPPSTHPGVARAVGQEYIIDADLAATNSSLRRRDALIQALTDQYFVTAGISAAQTHVAMEGKGKTWMLYFDRESPIWPKLYGPGNANHGADIAYCFGVFAMGDSLVKLHGEKGQAIANLTTQTDLDLSKAHMTYFTNFAKFGDPNGKAGSTSSYPKWPEYTLTDKSYMIFGSTPNAMKLEVKKDLRPRAAAFWLDYIPFVVGQTCPKPQPCPNPTCPPLLDQYIGYLRLTVGQAETVIVIFAVGTAVFGSLSLILLMAWCKLRHTVRNTGTDCLVIRPPNNSNSGTPQLTPVTTTEVQLVPTPRIVDKQQATHPVPTRAAIGNLGHNIVEEPTTSADDELVTTGKQTAPAGGSPKASIPAITIPICIVLLLFAGIFTTVCLVTRNRKRRLEESSEVSKNGGGWRERLASHVHPKRKDTRSSADDNHPYVLYSVNEGRARSFVHTPSFSEMPPLSAAAHIENEVFNFKDVDAILEQSETDVKFAGNDEVDTVRGIENVGYLPESPQVHAKEKSARSSRHEGAMVEVSSRVHLTETDVKESSGGSQPPVTYKNRDSGGIATQNSALIVQNGEGLAEETKIQMLKQKGNLSDLEVDTSIDEDDEISVRSSDSSGSSRCGYWAPKADLDNGGEEAEKGNEGNDGASSSGEDVSSIEDVEPPYSTWPVRKTSAQFSESGSDISLIEPIESEEEEDPYDTVVPGAPAEIKTKNVKPKTECISALDGQFSDGDGVEESPYDTLPVHVVSVHDEGTCEDKDCKSCHGKCDSGRVSGIGMADDVELPTSDLTICHQFAGGPKLGSDNSEGTVDEEESPYDTVPAGRPRSVEHVDGIDGEGVKKRSPTYATVPNVVLGPSFKEQVETFFVENVSSSEESLADEGEFEIDAKRMSLEISDLTNGDKCQGQNHLEDQGRIEITDDSFFFVGEGDVDSLKSV
ncbi:uncharacterized protein LOC135498345 [Lineus longissimus]|uniref:uncharacterized protein LOC135498345 n=1 Tax=Lineus longissimus TaxID=88925 RepID=UPI00315CADD0